MKQLFHIDKLGREDSAGVYAGHHARFEACVVWAQHDVCGTWTEDVDHERGMLEVRTEDGVRIGMIARDDALEIRLFHACLDLCVGAR